MTMLLEERRHEEVLVAVDPKALIAEARRRQRKRRLVIALIAAAAIAVSVAAFLVLRNASTPPSPATGGTAQVGRPTTLKLQLRGFGTPLPTHVDRGPCPQGRTLIEVQPRASVVGCVLTIRKWNAPNYGVKKIAQTARETYRLSGGTIVTHESQTIHYAHDQHHTTAVFRGRIVGGNGRYAHARGTIVGGGPGVDGHGNWTITLHLASG